MIYHYATVEWPRLVYFDYFSVLSLCQVVAGFELLIPGSVVECSTTVLPLLGQSSLFFFALFSFPGAKKQLD